MNSISLCMIVKNEEAVLERCLLSAKDVVDEIIIVDTGSTDRTKEIARSFTDKVYDFEWIDDFGAARNFAFSKASSEWQMWLDADDILLPQDAKAIIELKQTLPETVNMVMMLYHTSFDSDGRPTFSYYRERLMRRSKGYMWEGAIHEVITPPHDVLRVPIGVTHKKEGRGDPGRNLRIFENRVAGGHKLSPREQFYYGRELYYHGRWADAVQVLDAFLVEGHGWVENNIDACRVLAECYGEQQNPHGALGSLVRSFVYDTPRAETCCDLGAQLMALGRFNEAIYWYEAAMRCTHTPERGGFTRPDCYGYIPCLQICVCYDRLGRYKEGAEYNERAAEYKPNSPAVAQNREYFAKRLQPQAE